MLSHEWFRRLGLSCKSCLESGLTEPAQECAVFRGAETSSPRIIHSEADWSGAASVCNQARRRSVWREPSSRQERERAPLSLSLSLSRTFSDTAGWSKSRKLPVGESPRFACAKVAQGIEQVSRPTLFQVRPFSTRARRCHREGRTEATQSWRTFLHGQLPDISFC